MTSIPVAFEDLRPGDTVRAYVRASSTREFKHIYEGPATRPDATNVLYFANTALRDYNGSECLNTRFISATREVKVPTEEHILVIEAVGCEYWVPVYAKRTEDGSYISEDEEFEPDEITKWEPITRGKVQTR